jgi:MYXO-CTERM domain-containing protein
MKFFKPFILGAVLLAGVSAIPTSSAQIVFQDNFDSGQSGANWVSLLSGSDAFANFAYDYSSIGVPPAPNSAGTTVGMNFLVNQSAGVFQGISASPVDQHFSGDFSIRFDMWLNFIGPFPAGGSGSTQMASFGWGTNGATVQWAGANDSMLFAGSGDGGTTQDYRAYRAAGGAPLTPDTGVYAAGTSTTPDSRNNTDVYYASIGGTTAPAAQTTLFASQNGTTAAGTLGMAWHDMLIQKSGDTVSWSVDGLRIASVPIAGAALSGDNISFGMFDINAGSSTDPNDFLNTAIFDNVRVTAIPEPSAALLGALGLGTVFGRRRRNRE